MPIAAGWLDVVRLPWDGWILTANDEWHMVCHGMIPTYITSNPNT